MRVILVRHGETTWNAEQRLQGQDNAPLSQRGVQQAEPGTACRSHLQPAAYQGGGCGRVVDPDHDLVRRDLPWPGRRDDDHGHG